MYDDKELIIEVLNQIDKSLNIILSKYSSVDWKGVK